MADHEVIALAVDRRIRDEVVEVRVVGEAGGVGRLGIVVDEAPEEAERLRLRQADRAEVRQLHLERLRLVVQRADGSVEFALEERQRVRRREPAAKRLPGAPPQVPKLRAGAAAGRRFVHQCEIQLDVV